ncbi:type IX secretion system protein PorD [Thermophagus sp. OGC60D27]|uniref:type IX secretion system protein PorD n=1 Tax=Thermophagus sp. OGC60D27 TaxID=3458415 RepID=UPI0040383BB5
MMKCWMFILVLLCYLEPLSSQELRCAVQVVAPAVQGTNRNVFQSMRETISEFLNNHQWTNHVFETSERIECTFHFTISEVIGVNRFKGSLQIQSRRPVFNSAYSTTILNLKDEDIDFEYTEFESIVYNENNPESNLVAILAYYAYVILGYDYDTFSLEGGTPWFQKAEKIVGMRQNARESGWKQFEGRRNRYWLVYNLLENDHQPLRRFYYEYHRKGLDIMSEDPQRGRGQIADALKLLREVYRRESGSYALQLVFDAKQKELINLFSEAFSKEKADAVNVLSEVNPSNADAYQKMLND